MTDKVIFYGALLFLAVILTLIGIARIRSKGRKHISSSTEKPPQKGDDASEGSGDDNPKKDPKAPREPRTWLIKLTEGLPARSLWAIFIGVAFVDCILAVLFPNFWHWYFKENLGLFVLTQLSVIIVGLLMALGGKTGRCLAALVVLLLVIGFISSASSSADFKIPHPTFGQGSGSAESAMNLRWHFQSKIVAGHSDSPYDHPGMIAPQDVGALKYDPGFSIRFEVYGYDRGAKFTYKYHWDMAELAEHNHGYFVKTVGYDKDSGIFGNLHEEGPNSYLMDSIDQRGNRYVLHLWATTD